MLQIAANWIEQEKKDIAAAKEAYMAENCPAPDLNGDMAALTVRRSLVHHTAAPELSPQPVLVQSPLGADSLTVCSVMGEQ